MRTVSLRLKYVMGGKCVALTKAQKFDHLRTSRPTAVNLFLAADELTLLAERISKNSVDSQFPGTRLFCLQATGSEGSKQVLLAVIEAAEKMLAKDVQDNKGMMQFIWQRSAQFAFNCCLLWHL